MVIDPILQKYIQLDKTIVCACTTLTMDDLDDIGKYVIPLRTKNSYKKIRDKINKTNKYEYIKIGEYTAKAIINFKGYYVNVSNNRLYCLSKNKKECSICGAKTIGGILYVEKSAIVDSAYREPIWNVAHIALSPNGEPVLMTQDHKIPISKGGLNSTENLQPMCRNCNSSKADIIYNYELLYSDSEIMTIGDTFLHHTKKEENI